MEGEQDGINPWNTVHNELYRPFIRLQKQEINPVI